MTNAELQSLLARLPPDLPVKTYLPILGSRDWGIYEIENAYVEPFGEDEIILDGNKD